MSMPVEQDPTARAQLYLSNAQKFSVLAQKAHFLMRQRAWYIHEYTQREWFIIKALHEVENHAPWPMRSLQEKMGGAFSEYEAETISLIRRLMKITGEESGQRRGSLSELDRTREKPKVKKPFVDPFQNIVSFRIFMHRTKSITERHLEENPCFAPLFRQFQRVHDELVDADSYRTILDRFFCPQTLIELLGETLQDVHPEIKGLHDRVRQVLQDFIHFTLKIPPPLPGIVPSRAPPPVPERPSKEVLLALRERIRSSVLEPDVPESVSQERRKPTPLVITAEMRQAIEHGPFMGVSPSVADSERSRSGSGRSRSGSVEKPKLFSRARMVRRRGPIKGRSLSDIFNPPIEPSADQSPPKPLRKAASFSHFSPRSPSPAEKKGRIFELTDRDSLHRLLEGIVCMKYMFAGLYRKFFKSSEMKMVDRILDYYLVLTHGNMNIRDPYEYCFGEYDRKKLLCLSKVMTKINRTQTLSGTKGADMSIPTVKPLPSYFRDHHYLGSEEGFTSLARIAATVRYSMRETTYAALTKRQRAVIRSILEVQLIRDFLRFPLHQAVSYSHASLVEEDVLSTCQKMGFTDHQAQPVQHAKTFEEMQEQFFSMEIFHKRAFFDLFMKHLKVFPVRMRGEARFLRDQMIRVEELVHTGQSIQGALKTCFGEKTLRMVYKKDDVIACMGDVIKFFGGVFFVLVEHPALENKGVFLDHFRFSSKLGEQGDMTVYQVFHNMLRYLREHEDLEMRDAVYVFLNKYALEEAFESSHHVNNGKRVVDQLNVFKRMLEESQKT